MVSSCGPIQRGSAQFDASAPEPLPRLNGTLFLHGGGIVSDEARERFSSLAGGKNARIVVIPTADTKDPLNEKKLNVWSPYPYARIDILHASSREQALDPKLSEILEQATGVWLSGGKQTKLIDTYAGTPVETRIHQLLDRGGIVGGTSAGSAVISKVMLVYSELRSGFDWLPGAIVDQHFLVRNRLARLESAVSMYPEQVGFGIDEGTALIVNGRNIEVLGESTVTVCLAASSNRPARLEILKTGMKADLIALRRAAVSRFAPPFPSAEPLQPAIKKGSLFIGGGGGISNQVMNRFFQLAGGEQSHIVYIPCSDELEIEKTPTMVQFFSDLGAGSVQWLHTKDRKLADDLDFLQPLAKATGIWFGGGRQWNLVDSYQNTEAHRFMHKVLERGGVIGGSSAGASIQGDYMPRGSPLGNREIMAEGYERGLGFLTGVAIDQHFTQRNRFKDMALLKRTFPQLLGIGIDEKTALVVQGQRAEIVGEGKVAFYDKWQGNHEIETFSSFEAGTIYDLVDRKKVVNEEKVKSE